MDGGSCDSNPQSTLEEEAKKGNTDCVYFLASPLTCIKGADCEYRHSETARVNPRDCWFWLNGNCLNPKCAFRHPPLDGFRGASGTSSSGASHPSLPPAVPVQLPQYVAATYHCNSHTSNRQKVPCYYFQKGNCLKGDKCPFMHGPQLTNEPVPPQSAKATSVFYSQSIKKIVNGSENPSFKQKTPPQASFVQPGASHHTGKGDETGRLPSTGNTIQKNKAPQNGDDELTRSIHTDIPAPSVNALSRLQLHVQPQDERFQNGKDVDECLGESPPGFDVLVADGEEEEYFGTDMETAPGHGGMHLSSRREFDYMGSCTHDEFEGEDGELGACDVYGQKQEQRGWEQRHAPLERFPERESAVERRLMSRDGSPNLQAGQDLRYRLSKRRRINRSGAIASPNRRLDSYRGDDQLVEERYRHSRQEQLQHPSTESSLSKRLRGRVKFPGRPSVASAEPYSDLKSEQRRMRGRSSPSSPAVHQGRHHEKVTGQTNEDVTSEAKSFRGRTFRSEERKTDTLDFTGPKSLAELKSAKVSGIGGEQTSPNRMALRSRVVHGEEEKSTKLRVCQDSNTLSFEGPKPLSDILKRKREPGSANSSDSKKDAKQNNTTDVTDLRSMVAQHSEMKNDVNQGNHSPTNTVMNLELDSADEVHPLQSDELPTEVGYIAEGDASMSDPQDADAENLERDRESDVVIEGEENQDVEDEYLDDEDGDDGDDFARKLGVMFT